MKNADVKPTTEFTRVFAESLKELLRTSGVSHAEVAYVLGVSRSKITERLNGLRPLDTDIIDVCAVLLGVSPRQLVRMIIDEIEVK